MSDVKLGKRIVDASLPRSTRYTVFDSAISGFGLRVYPSGKQSWVFEYRPGEGGRGINKKRVQIGDVGGCTPEQARKEADRLRAIVRMGGDPQADKSDLRKALTVEALSEIFLEDIKGKRAVATYQGYRQAIELHVLKRLGSKKAVSVQHTDIAKLHRLMRDQPAQANKVLRVLSSMYNFASSRTQKLLPAGTNPTTDIEKYPEHARVRMLSPDELDRLGETLKLAETAGLPWLLDPEKKHKHLRKVEADRVTILSPYATAAIRLLIFTGARLREILNLTWEDVEFSHGTLSITKHKTLRLTGPKTIVLNLPALEVIRSLERIGKYVIAGDSAGREDERPRSDLQRPWDAIRRHAGIHDVRIHDLRHNFGAFGASGNLGLPQLGKLLGHSNAGSTARYAHFQFDPQRQASNSIGLAIKSALGQ